MNLQTRSMLVIALFSASTNAGVTAIEYTPTDLASGDTSYFTTSPTSSPELFLGLENLDDYRTISFNTAPDGALSEGGNVNTQYTSLGVTMNDIRISAIIYGGNNYGAGFATEDNIPQIFNFTTPVLAAGIVNTSPDRDLVQFYSGADGTGELLLEFRDQENIGVNFNIDRFVGGIATDGTTIGSMVVSNQSGDLELDELIFVVPSPGGFFVLGLAGFAMSTRRR